MRDELQTIHTLKVKPELQPLYDYLVGRGSFVQLDNFNPKYLPIFSRDVLKRIASGDESWDEMVPPQVAEIIRQPRFFRLQKRLKAYIAFDSEVTSIPTLFNDSLLWLIFLGTGLPQQEDIGIGGLAVLLGASGANTVARIIVDAEENGLARTAGRLQARRHLGDMKRATADQ